MAGEKRDRSGTKIFSRRDFVAGGGTVVAGGALNAWMPPTAIAQPAKYPLSEGYLVYDSRRCAGCLSCMLACSLVHEGAASISLSRIQVSRAVLARYPYDIHIAVCRQCPDPPCVENCPTQACHVSANNGNVRTIDAPKCIGCGACLKACPHTPHRTVRNPVSNKSSKCDLCAEAPHFGRKGGPSGSQACVAACPMGALKLVSELPSQADISGYDVNLTPPPAPKTGSGSSKPAQPAKQE